MEGLDSFLRCKKITFDLGGGAVGFFFAVQKNHIFEGELEDLFFAVQKSCMVVGRVKYVED